MKETVYDSIRNMIFTRQIKAGDKLSEHQLAKELNVSRTPVREAVKRLATEGIVKIYPNRFAEVVTYGEEDLMNLCIIRITLETLAVKLAVLYGNNKEFMDLKDYAERCLEAAHNQDMASRLNYDMGFHLMLTQIGKNEILHDQQRNLQQRVMLWQCSAIENPDDRLDGLQGHIEIADALFERDTDHLITMVQEHLYVFYQSFLSESSRRSIMEIVELKNKSIII